MSLHIAAPRTRIDAMPLEAHSSIIIVSSSSSNATREDNGRATPHADQTPVLPALNAPTATAASPRCSLLRASASIAE
ncbi:hypothetical protein HJFPF1_07734 [Paramyrothecium foliicola]|nr:hypothetical protein HJFPF1_07734 [Paramyrothecium foliicola]